MPSLVLDRDQTIKNAIKQVEEMRKDLSNALHAAASVESRTAVAEYFSFFNSITILYYFCLAFIYSLFTRFSGSAFQDDYDSRKFDSIPHKGLLTQDVEIDGGSGSASLTDLLKHDKVLSKKPPAPHRVVPDYLLNATTKEASKRVKLANLGRRGFKKKFKEDKDPLKSFSVQFISWRPTP